MDDTMRKAEILNCETKSKEHSDKARQFGNDLCRLFKIALGGQFESDAKDELLHAFYSKLGDYRIAEGLWASAEADKTWLKKNE